MMRRVDPVSLQPPSKTPLWLPGAWLLFAAGVMVYAQTLAYTGDEGFHVLAAQLIKAGKRPYLDFCFPQTPLNAYWSAFWMSLFGESWRVIHAMAALLTVGAVILTAHFVLTRFPEREWRAAGALVATALVGLNLMVVEFGPLGQAYGMCLFATVCAYRLAVTAAERRSSLWAGAAGLMAGAGAACTLLSASVAPVLLIWLLWNLRGQRWRAVLAFLAGAAIPFIPVLILFVQKPWVVWFNVAQYHLYYRIIYWPHPLPHDLEVLTGWSVDPQALVLGLLAISGLFFIARRSQWTREQRSEFYLSGWLALGISAELAFGHPTFARYFCLTAPFLGILGVAGLYAIGSRVFAPERPFWPAAIVAFLSAAALARGIYSHAVDVYNWPEFEDIARKIAQVTPPSQPMFADEIIYFLTKRRPLPGMEFEYSHKLTLPPAKLAALHAMPDKELKRLLAAGAFYSATTCDDDTVDDYGLDDLFTNKVMVHDCPVYWQPKRPAAAK
jgi:hypothetical protein